MWILLLLTLWWYNTCNALGCLKMRCFPLSVMSGIWCVVGVLGSPSVWWSLVCKIRLKLLGCWIDNFHLICHVLFDHCLQWSCFNLLKCIETRCCFSRIGSTNDNLFLFEHLGVDKSSTTLKGKLNLAFLECLRIISSLQFVTN